MNTWKLGGPMLAMIALVALTSIGCSREPGEEKPASQNEESSSAAPAEGALVGMSLDVPSEWESRSDGNETTFWRSDGWHFTLYVQPEGESVDVAAAEAAKIVAGTVADFTVTKSEDATVAGSPARHLTGTGTEADDGDPSNAEIYIFPVAGRVRVACLHGEGDATKKLVPMALAILETAKSR